MDPRNKPTTHGGVDLNDIDPAWIKNCTSAKKMRSAVKLLTEDGYYPDLLKIAEEKLCELDPEYRRRKELPRATEEDRAAAARSIEDFLAEIERPKQKSEEEQRLERAREERMRGNECVAAHDYKVAVRYYERSIKLDPSEAATYSNRALAYLKLNDHKNAFSDAETAIGLMPGYLKAYHRRAEAALGLGEYERGYIDVRAILSIEPENAGVKDTMAKILKKAQAAKVELDPENAKNAAAEIVSKVLEAKGVKQVPKVAPKVKKEEKTVKEEGKKKEGEFVKVAITEEGDSSDSEEEDSSNARDKIAKEKNSIWAEEEVSAAQPLDKKKKLDMDQKEIDELLDNYTKQKDEGNKLNKAGQYSEAIKKYLQAIVELTNTKGLPEDVLKKYEAIANSNIAVCYKQMQDSNNVLVHTSKIIDSKVPDNAILVKTLVLRAFAYESIDKLKEARDDWAAVKQLQWNNTDASLGLERINEAFKKDKGQRIGEVLRSIKPKLEECKKDGNAQYKAGKYTEAVESFSKGIDLFQEKCKDEDFTHVPKDLLQIVSQLYTNRALSYHMLNRHKEVVEDTTFVIARIDPKNPKAYHRRGVALSKLEDNEKALIDLQQASSLDPNSDSTKGEMKRVLDIVIEERKKKLKPEAKKEPEGQKKMIEEISSSAKSVVSQSKDVAKKKITDEQITKAAALAAQSLGKDYLKRPKTAYAFESTWRSYKDDKEKLCTFLYESVDPDYFATLFKENEIPTEVYLSLIEVLNNTFKEYL